MSGFFDPKGRGSAPPAVHDPAHATDRLVGRLGHEFADPGLLVAALTHPSWRNEHEGSLDNQRLEFLGDAVLGLVITHELVSRLPRRGEGELTVLKSQLVRESCLAGLAEELELGAALRLGKGEDQTGGRKRPSVLADALEAVFGAVLLDAGYARAREVILALLGPSLETVIDQVEAVLDQPAALSASIANWKTAIQELLQKHGEAPPTYRLVGEEGPEHARRFQVEATTRLGERPLVAQGEGTSKKAAEHEAARVLYESARAELAARTGAARPRRVASTRDGAVSGDGLES